MVFRFYFSLFVFLLFFVLVFFLGVSLHAGFAGLGINEYDRKKADFLLNESISESSLLKREQLLRKAYKLNPHDSKIQFALGKLLYIRKKDKEAKVLLIKAYKDSKLTYRVFTYLADYFYSNGKVVEAIFYLEKLIITFKEGNTYLNNFRLGVLKERLKRYRQANYFFLRAHTLRKHEDNKEILLRVARNYFFLSEYKRVLFYLSSYPYTNKDNQAAFRLLLRTHYKLGNRKDLSKGLGEYLGIWPNDVWVKRFPFKF